MLKEHISHSKSLRLKNNALLMYCAPKAFVYLEWNALSFFHSPRGRSPLLQWKRKKVERRVEKKTGYSTQDINILGVQHIKGAFFFSWMLFEWDVYIFTMTCIWIRPSPKASEFVHFTDHIKFSIAQIFKESQISVSLIFGQEFPCLQAFFVLPWGWRLSASYGCN